MTVFETAPPVELTTGRQGHYAGVVSRLVGFGADVGIAWGAYTVGAGALSLVVSLFTGHNLNLSEHPLAAGLVFFGWGFVYFTYQWAMAGKTLGMAIFGLRVVQADGSPLRLRQAAVRTLVLPLAIVLFWVVALQILVQRERRGLHDAIARTAVVYDWDARAARLRWLARREGPAPG